MEKQIKKHITAVCAIIVHDGAILCTKRNDTGQWEFPGGKVEEGESFESALKREIWEELGVHIEVGKRLSSETMMFETAVVTLVPFLCSSRILPELSTDHSELKWTSPKDLKSLDWMPLDIPIVMQVAELH